MGPSVEVQVHTAGRRGRMVRLRLNRAWLTAISIVALLYCFLLAFAAGVAPGVAAALFGGQEYRTLAGERARQGERLQDLVARLEQLRERSATLLLAVRKVSAAYELPVAGAVGPAARAAGGEGRPAAGAGGGEGRLAAGAGGEGRPVAGAGGEPGIAAAVDAAASSTSALEGAGALASSSIYAGAVSQGERLESRIGGQLDALERGLAAIAAFEGAHEDQVRDTPGACPLAGDRYVLTSPFGRQRSAFTRDLGFHAGIDLAAPRGTPILAAADGVVTFAGVYPLARSPVWWRFGNLIAIVHGDRFVTLYGHCGDLKVRAGQAVRRGETLALVGSSGWSVSPHLHYEVRRRGADGTLVPVDPLTYILDRRWPNEERLVARGRGAGAAGEVEPLPAGFERPAAGRRRR